MAHSRVEFEDVIVSSVRPGGGADEGPEESPMDRLTPGPDDDTPGPDDFAIDSFATDWLAEDHAPVDPSDPSAGLRPMESLFDPSDGVYYKEQDFPADTHAGGAFPTESIMIVLEGFELML